MPFVRSLRRRQGPVGSDEMPTYQHLFDAAIDVEPPPRFDVDELVAVFRRRLRRRRAAEGAAVAFTVAAVAIGGSTAMGHWPVGWRPIPPDVGNSPTTGSPTTAMPTPTVLARPTNGPEPTEPVSAADTRLTAAMQAAVLRVAPGAELLPFVSGGRVPFELVPYAFDEPALPYRGRAHVLIDGRTGDPTVTVEVGVIGSQPRPTCAGQQDCAETSGPAGERIVVLTMTTTRGSGAPLAELVDQVPGVEHTVWV